MLDLYAELRRVVQAFESGAIPYAIAGGVAVSIYTVPRATEDIDVLVAREDLPRSLTALEPLGFRPAGRPMDVAGGRLQIQRLIKIEGADLLPLDLLMATDPELAGGLSGRTAVEVEGRQVWVVALDGLRSRSPRTRGLTGMDVTTRLQKVAALRAFARQLPHLDTPAETERLRRFVALAASPDSATREDVDALASGWARWWRTGQTRQLLAMAESLPEGLVAQDRRLATYLEAARASAGPGPASDQTG